MTPRTRQRFQPAEFLRKEAAETISQWETLQCYWIGARLPAIYDRMPLPVAASEQCNLKEPFDS
eukprot:SAG22_NODE_1516_length_4248_cov_83.377042_3_plen_64_part_00